VFQISSFIGRYIDYFSICSLVAIPQNYQRISSELLNKLKRSVQYSLIVSGLVCLDPVSVVVAH
jgi:hypothetical protein